MICVGNGVALGLEPHRGKAQQRAKNGAQSHQGKQGGQQGILCYEFDHLRYTRPAKPMKASDIRPAVTMPEGGALEGLRYVGHVESFTHGGEQHQYQGKTDRRAKAVKQRLQEIVVLADIEQGDAQHGAVGGDQRQVDAQHAVQQRAALAHHHLGKLHHHRDDQDKGNGLEVAQPEGDAAGTGRSGCCRPMPA